MTVDGADDGGSGEAAAASTWRPTSYSGSHQPAVKSGMPDWMVPMGLILGLVPLYQPLQGEGVGVREGQGVH